jgi:hypothetical protein
VAGHGGAERQRPRRSAVAPRPRCPTVRRAEAHPPGRRLGPDNRRTASWPARCCRDRRRRTARVPRGTAVAGRRSPPTAPVPRFGNQRLAGGRASRRPWRQCRASCLARAAAGRGPRRPSLTRRACVACCAAVASLRSSMPCRAAISCGTCRYNGLLLDRGARLGPVTTETRPKACPPASAGILRCTQHFALRPGTATTRADHSSPIPRVPEPRAAQQPIRAPAGYSWQLISQAVLAGQLRGPARGWSGIS